MPIRLNGAAVDERTLRAIATFILLYVGAWVVGSSVIAIEAAISGVALAPLDALATSATALGNVGPGFGITGPMGSFAPLGDVFEGHADRASCGSVVWRFSPWSSCLRAITGVFDGSALADSAGWSPVAASVGWP